jgi:hypothetical protein
MVRLARRAVWVDRRARLVAGIEPVVALGAKAAELAEAECR